MLWRVSILDYLNYSKAHILTVGKFYLFFREVLKKNPKLAGQLSVLITNKLNTLNNETKTFIDELMKGYKSKGLTEAQISEELIMQFGDALLNDNVVIGFIIYKY